MPHITRDTPCPVCGGTTNFDLSYLATRFQDGTERWGRAHACGICGVVRFYDRAKPVDFEGLIGSDSLDATTPE